MCLSGMDYTGGKLGVVYHLHSMKLNHKIVLKVEMTAEHPHVPVGGVGLEDGQLA